MNTHEGEQPQGEIDFPFLATVETDLRSGRYEQDRTPSGLPIITEATFDQLCELYNLGEDPITRRVIQSINPSRRDNQPIVIGVELAKNFFGLLSFGDQVLLRKLNEWGKERYKKEKDGIAYQDSAAVGMASIAHAFWLQIGPGFVDKLRDLPRDFHVPSLKSPENLGRMSIMEAALMPAGIPHDQVFLNTFVDRFVSDNNINTYHQAPVREGMVTMYRALEDIAPHIM